MRRIRHAGLIVVGLLSIALSGVPAAEAILLAPGGTGAPDSLVASGILVATITSAVPVTSSNGKVTLTYTAQVFRDPTDVGPAFAACTPNCLDFVYIVTNSATSIDAIGRITASSIAPGPSGSFVGFNTDVGSTSGPGVPPSTVDRSLSGGTIGFNFAANSLAPGTTTQILVIETNARFFDFGSLNVIDGGVTTVQAWAPSTVQRPELVPEPATILLIGSGLVGLGIVARRIRRAS